MFGGEKRGKIKAYGESGYSKKIKRVGVQSHKSHRHIIKGQVQNPIDGFLVSTHKLVNTDNTKSPALGVEMGDGPAISGKCGPGTKAGVRARSLRFSCH